MSPYEKFWHSFTRHEAELFNFEKDQQRIFDKLFGALRKVNQDLVFEFGPKKQQEGKERREFVISAGGIKSAFPAVISLRDAAPDLPRWHITAFRPRRVTINVVRLGINASTRERFSLRCSLMGKMLAFTYSFLVIGRMTTHSSRSVT
jgi:hypothetical protein